MTPRSAGQAVELVEQLDATPLSSGVFPQFMAKKIAVLNSPWGRSFERPSDCERWVRQGHAFMSDQGLTFTSVFLQSQLRQAVEFDPTHTDDGVARRWAKGISGNPFPAEISTNGELLRTREATKKDRCGYGLIARSPDGIDAKQLLRIDEVGTGSFVSRHPDKLRRRQYRLTRSIERDVRVSTD